MWKLLTGILANEMYEFLDNNNIFPEEQKGCKRKSRGTKDQLLIDKAVLKDCKVRKTNLGMAWIDYRKAFDMVPHSWILECMSMFGIAKNMEEFLKNSMAKWKTELFVYGQSLGQVNIKRGIFQGDSLSPLLFVLCMIPLTLQCDKMIEYRKPDIVLVDKVQQKCLIIDVACPGDNRIAEKEEEKLQRYDLLKREIKRLWRMKNIDIIPIIVGALGSITTELGKRIEQLNIEIAIEKLQKTTLLGTARILRKVLEIET